MKRWCRVYECWREAAEGSDFCRVKHGWWEPEPVLAPVVPLPLPEPEPIVSPVLMIVRDCIGCEQSFEQERKSGRPFSYCEMCRGVAA